MAAHPIENFTIAVLAKGTLAEMRMLIERCEDRETAQSIYREMRNLEHKLAVKYKFADTSQIVVSE